MFASVRSIYFNDQVIFSSFMIGVIGASVLVNMYFSLCTSDDILRKQTTRTKYGACYSDLDITRKSSLFQSTLFYFIRTLFVVVLVMFPYDQSGL